MQQEIILEPLEKAIHSLGVALQQPLNEFTRDATIQRFEYSFELTWKIMRRYLEIAVSVKEYSIRSVFREVAKIGLIDDVTAWFRYHEARNLTVHTYNENTANETYQVIKQFYPDVCLFLENLKNVLRNATDTN